MWWYTLVLVISFAMAMATIYTGHSALPWYVNIHAYITVIP